MRRAQTAARILAGLLVWTCAPAADDTNLGALRARLERLRAEVAAGEDSQSEARDQLRESERAISEANRVLRELAADRDRLRVELRRIETQRRLIGTDIGSRQDGLARLLVLQHLHGGRATAQVVFSGADPGRIARQTHYLGRIARAQAALIGAQRAALAQLRVLEERSREAATSLSGIEAEQRGARARLVQQQAERRMVLTRTAVRIREQRRQIRSLERDESRLSRLVEQLGKVLAAAAPPRGPRNERIPEAVSGEHAFARSKGALRLPTRGELIGRFGTPRPGEGPKWKGLFIRAASGQEVRAVAAGRVVYADWMRGFGNLLILDHGSDYLTIYANNESVLTSVGEAVRTGDVIATVGASGGSEESGLYFEMRHQGRAFDPLRWVSLK